MITDLMIDLETMSNTSRAAIVSIGATLFNIETGEKFSDFYRKVNLQSCLDAGLEVNASTIMWWMSQNAEARSYITNSSRKHISKALLDLSIWAKTEVSSAEEFKNLRVWGNSNRFDMGILSDAYNAINQPIFWNFRNERDVRTLVAFAPQFKENEQFTGTPHHPVHDCHHQIKYCVKTWNFIKQGIDYHEQLNIQNKE